jgi:hypothetical protein
MSELNALLGSARKYGESDEITLKRFEAKARQLLKVNPAEGHNVLSTLFQLKGDLQKAVEHIDIALNLKAAAVLECNKASLLANFGKFLEAQRLFKSGATPERGEFTNRWRLGACCGAWHVLNDFCVVAKRMELDGFTNVDQALISRVVQLMDQNSITDQDLGGMQEIAGSILREERMYFVGLGPDVFVWDQDPIEKYLAITFRLPVTSRRAIELDRELGRRLFAEISNLPFAIMLHFESGLPSNERFAERSAEAR